jgi:ABC-type lipoprotein release transport system permease subunit
MAAFVGAAGSYFFMLLLSKLFYNFVGTIADVTAAIVVLLLAAVLASLIAASRIASIEPVVLLRNE